MTIEEQYTLAKNTLNGRLFAPTNEKVFSGCLQWNNNSRDPRGDFSAMRWASGKTIQLIATMLGNPQERTLLIVPKSIITQWVEEIAKFAPTLTVGVFDGPERKLGDHDVTIAPYSLLSVKGGKAEAVTPLHRVQWDRVVLDEAHEIRNKSSKDLQECLSSSSWYQVDCHWYPSLQLNG